MNKNCCYVVLLASVALLSAFCTNNKTLPITVKTEPEAGFAVVELFTSEGCSSCPAADKAVEELAKQYPSTVYVLAFHVDYWNRLGWTDEFSKPEYTQRQNEYASKFHLESIYTPQVIINGKHEFVGSDKTKLAMVTTAELKKHNGEAIELKIEKQDTKSITIQYKTTTAQAGLLHIALVQKEGTTDVKRGENGGRKLHHTNLVRDFKTISITAAPEGNTSLKIPSGLQSSGSAVIAYLQKDDGSITAVKRIEAGMN